MAFALLTEALRREALLGVLVQMTKEPGYPQRILQLSTDEKEQALCDLAGRVQAQIQAVTNKLVRGVVEETLLRIVQD